MIQLRNKFVVAIVVLCGLFACRQYSSRNVSAVYSGLYVSSDTVEFKVQAPFLLLRNGLAYYAWDQRRADNLVKDYILQYSTRTKYLTSGDSVFFVFDSLFVGFNTRSIVFDNRIVVDSIPQYDRRFKYTFRCAYQDGGLVSRIEQFDTENNTQVVRMEMFIPYTGK